MCIRDSLGVKREVPFSEHTQELLDLALLEASELAYDDLEHIACKSVMYDSLLHAISSRSSCSASIHTWTHALVHFDSPDLCARSSQRAGTARASAT
eukprot:325178-Prorocentrum_minimum.AAC.1